MDERQEEGRAEIRLLHGYAVVEQETDENGRVLRWRQLTVSFPMNPGGTMSFSFDFMNQGEVSIGMNTSALMGDEWHEQADEGR
jgi:hypothetical protein